MFSKKAKIKVTVTLYCTGSSCVIDHDGFRKNLSVLKGQSHEIDLIFFYKFTELGLNKGRGMFLNFSEVCLIFK
jgi:hypothetical protein